MTDKYEDEYRQFVDCLPPAKRRRLNNDYKSLSRYVESMPPIKYQILTSKMPESVKIKALEHYRALISGESTGDSEYHNRWLDVILKLPWNNQSDKQPKLDYSRFSLEKMTFLDTVIYGQRCIKRHFIHKAIHMLNRAGRPGTVTAIEGPPGCGKTTLIKDGFCRMLDRPFKMINLGGAKDSVYLKGGEPIYKNAAPGRLVQLLIECQSFSPVIYFDELDKISQTDYGKELSDFLMHIVDPVANGKIYDLYLDLELDLSKAIFIFSFNDRSKVDPILLDRLDVLSVEEYTPQDRVNICKMFLLPKYCRQHQIDSSRFKISDRVLEHVIKKTAGNERGIRGLERSISHLIGNIHLHYMVGDQVYRQLIEQSSTPAKIEQNKTNNKGNSRIVKNTCLEITLNNLYMFLNI